MVLLENTRNPVAKHKRKREWWVNHNVEVKRNYMFFGDFALPNSYKIYVTCIKGMSELVSYLLGKNNNYLKTSCAIARDCKVTHIVLVENWDGINDLSQLASWVNPRLNQFRNGKKLYPTAATGARLKTCCEVLQRSYGTTFVFCSFDESADKIIRLLTGGESVESDKL